MTPSSVAILKDPHPCGHIVFPYTDEGRVAEAVHIFVSAGLENDEAVVLIATDDHCNLFINKLSAEGYDVRALRRTEQLIVARAQDALARFMVDGMPDEQLFSNAVCEMIQRAKASGRNGRERRVRLFGEMVSLLWRVDPAAATRLEELWNGVIEKHKVSLLCTYTLDNGGAHCTLPECLTAPHSATVSY